MGKPEVGSTKYLSTQMRRKGLQKLKWWCELCQKQCFDDNGFKLHCQSESHTRNALAAGQNFKQTQEEFSQAFLKNFIQLLKTGHGEKEIQINRFYQEVIADKSHVHLNSTRWPSLTEFAKYLGRESICRVEEKEDGIFISWIDDSPEALRRRDALRRRELQDRGDEEREQMMLREQIRRAQKDAEARGTKHDEEEREGEKRELRRQEGEKVKLSLGGIKAALKPDRPSSTGPGVASPAGEEIKAASGDDLADPTTNRPPEEDGPAKESDEKPRAGPKPLSMKLGTKPQLKNVFAQAKKNALAGGAKKGVFEQPKKMSEAERIMLEELKRKEEMDKKRARAASGSAPPLKKQRY